ncbi:hypothetical protein KL921_002146 [Ogataea angusta]|nr:hypothetical protein KL921_002146 [Ogataea angusta]KAG7824435.1 hypothetical protein KL909_002433 [Ogataea angusta]KAG7834992.1 hypothetical protein KL943_002307 [Ogataea angusta]KAG7848962.1 hypothetical protein KL941_001780 [Ogataea angusta]KAG7861258.1 hypothetical protein KL919_001992 [Ogataea angusta]
MAPSLPVYSREELRDHYPHLFPERIVDEQGREKLNLDNCKLWSLTQHQCTFDGDRTICVPFKRVFARCKDTEYYSRKELSGFKLLPEQRGEKETETYRNIEITTEKDNPYSAQDPLLADFLRADKVLHQKMNQYYENIIRESEN